MLFSHAQRCQVAQPITNTSRFRCRSHDKNIVNNISIWSILQYPLSLPLFCRSRQDIERDYYREWERTTLIAKEELDRPMTIFTFLAFLPTWFRFYGLPGPVRFVLYLIWQRVAAAGHKVHKKLVIEGAKVDRELINRSKLPENMLSRKMVLLRYHHRISALENIKFRVALLQGKVYRPKVLPPPPNNRHIHEQSEEYDPTRDPWVAA